MSLTLPDITRVDFSNPDDIGTLVTGLFQTGCDNGMAQAISCPTPESDAIRRLAHRVTQHIGRQLPLMSPADALLVISAYDLAHRLAYGTPASTTLTDRYLLQAFEAMIHGDKEVDQYVVYRLIDQRLTHATMDDPFLDRPLRWLSIALDRWHRQFSDGTCHDALPLYDTVQRVTILLTSDLRAYETTRETAYKQRLAQNHRHLPAHPTAEPRTRQALTQLQQALSRYLPSPAIPNPEPSLPQEITTSL